MKPVFHRTLVLALAAVALTCGVVAAEERSQIAEKYTWNTADLYPSEEAWQSAKNEIAARVPGLARFKGRLGDSADAFYTALSTRMDLDRDLTKLQTYAEMRRDEDTRIGKSIERAQAGQALAVQYFAAISYFRPEILALGADKVNAFVAADTRLAPYKTYLDNILRWAPHTLSPDEEKVAATAGNVTESGASISGVLRSADIPWPAVTLSSGDKVVLDNAGYTRYRALNERADRDLVFKTFFEAYKTYGRTFAATLYAQVQGHLFDKEVHRFDSSLDAALFTGNIPTAVYRQLVADVHANLPTLHRYLKLRQRMMGLDQLRYEDLYAPIVKKVELRYTPEQAMDLTLKGVALLGPDYVGALKKGFDSRWVDFFPSPGKRPGAYSTGVFGVHPFQLQNFTGLYEEVSTLAHESGHSMHTYLSDQKQPYVTHEYAIFVAEVASTLNENLLLHTMLNQTRDRDTRLFLLGNALDQLRTTLFRQTLFAEFELRIHEMAERGETLTGDNMTKLYLDLVRQYYGHDQGVCKVDDLYGIEWAYIPHFYRGFYVYQYATSMVASNSIAGAIRAEAAAKKPSTKARDAYLAMLSSGSSRYPIDLLKGAGVDMLTPAPFAASMKEMNSIMDEMEKLLK